MKAAKRFFRMVAVDPATGCWNWTGGKHEKGYGTFYSGHSGPGKYVKAHRWSYEFYGGTLESGQHLRHKCDNPACVNPWHLVPGTNYNNVNDAVDRGRHPSGTDNSRAIFTAEQVRYIRQSPESCAAIAAKFGCGPQTVWCARIGKSYRNVK